jgi:hypothetical protein
MTMSIGDFYNNLPVGKTRVYFDGTAWDVTKHPARPTIADVLDAAGNALDVCGHCPLLPTTTGWVRAAQAQCPMHSPEA